MNAGELWRRAESSRLAGDLVGARREYCELVRIASIACYAHLRLADLDLSAGELRASSGHALQAYRLAHDEPSLLAQLCRQLFGLGEIQAALDVASRLDRISDSAFPLLAQIAKLLSDSMEPVAALALLAHARDAGLPPSAGGHYLEGLNRLYLGELDRAFDALTASVGLDPAFAPAYWSLAKLRRQEQRGERIDRLQSLLERHQDSHPDAALWLYSLFHELDADDQVDRAWPILQRAMRARGHQVPYDEPRESALLRRLTGDMRKWASHHDLQSHHEDDGSPMPVMVVGMPRTGTTIIEQSLCRSRDMQAAGELHDYVRQMRWIANRPGGLEPDTGLIDAIQPGHLDELGRRYRSHTVWRAQGASRYSDKWPENYLVQGIALASLPGLRVLAVRRDAMDSCWSNLREWFGGAYRYSYDVKHVARRQVAYKRLLDSACEAFGERIVAADYEDFVRSPEVETNRLAELLGLPTREQAMPVGAAVATASAVQVRERITDGNIGTWRRYERWLGPLQAALETAQRIEESHA
ncbi:tetratricopeptide repeat-containing sulfotransferase family protein [Thermomonas carbonis]|uniref:tetratricopeptide repeat-containing sulfotransferase family protein n=1 Tax=Thermomonas carbonis TaxID=1463158 RepID=UPI00167AED0B|nr:sulfotransferase [Thermomonas carbonis]